MIKQLTDFIKFVIALLVVVATLAAIICFGWVLVLSLGVYVAITFTFWNVIKLSVLCLLAVSLLVIVKMLVNYA